MVEEIIATCRSCQSSGVIRPGDVSPSRIEGVGWSAVQLVRDEDERIGIEAFLSCHLTGSNDARFDLEVTHVMGGENTFDVDNCPLSVALLDQRR